MFRHLGLAWSNGVQYLVLSHNGAGSVAKQNVPRIVPSVAQTYARRRGHPTVGVARFGSKVSDRLTSLSEEQSSLYEKLLVYSF